MRRSSVLSLVLLSAVALVAAPGGASGRGAAPPTPRSLVEESLEYGFQGEGPGRIDDVDRRTLRVQPSGQQRAIARRLGDNVRWNPFGTPHVLTRTVGHLTAPRAGAHADIARAFVRDNAALFRLTAAETSPDRLERILDHPMYESPDLRRMMHGQRPLRRDVAHIVIFRQRFGSLNAANDGLLTIGVTRDGAVTWVSSSVTGDTRLTGSTRLDAVAAWRAAARDVRVPADGEVQIAQVKNHAGFTTLRAAGLPDEQLVRLVALPVPGRDTRLAWEVDVLRAHPTATDDALAFISFVDAETGEVLVRRNSLQHAAQEEQPEDPPFWKVFPTTPDNVNSETKQGSPDNRSYWCWATSAGCDFVTATDPVQEAAQHNAWDVNPYTGVSNFTTKGNNAETAPSYVSQLTPDNYVGPVSSSRTYDFPFTDQWFENDCDTRNFFTPERNDIDASTVNLFAMHNRMHDWGYYLGWIESTWNMQRRNFGEDHPDSPRAKDQDPETGQSQAGAIPGGIAFLGRDNANQITLQDGTPGVTNQYLWHPLQAGFYSPCVDGAYDMGIVAHEVTHAITNRMTAGPDVGLAGHQAGAMGESWSDLAAVEYLNGTGFPIPPGASKTVVAPYATGNGVVGIRNYDAADSPLDYSNIGYDFAGPASVHSNGEIWGATNLDLRQAFIDKYDDEFPATLTSLQAACAEGLKLATECPGNRRWIQLMIDGLLLQPSTTSMLDSRDAQIESDKMRFDGANQQLMWDVFASRGMGDDAVTADNQDLDPSGGWDSPLRSDEAQVQFVATALGGGGVPAELEVYVGTYEARITPAATASGGAPSAVVKFVPGTYEFVARADGYGHFRFSQTFAAGEKKVVKVPMRRNHASAAHGAEAAGDGGNFTDLIDDTEASNWAVVNEGDVGGKQVTVALADGPQTVAEVQVSAALRAADASKPYDTGAQNRFSALRSFEILTCDASAGADCESDEGFEVIFKSADDAFPGVKPRPTAPTMQLRAFDVPDTQATHVRLHVLTNQCTGGPDFTGAANPMADPFSDPDCVDGFTLAAAPNITNTQRARVRAAELQVFSMAAPVVGGGTVAPPPVPPPAPRPQPKPQPKPDPLPATGGLLMWPPLLLAAAGLTLVTWRRRRA